MAREQDTVAGAKLDTILLLDGSNQTTDKSQFLTNLTASGAGAIELNSARGRLLGPRTVSVRWTATAAELSVALVIHGNTAMTDYTFGIGTNGSGFLFFLQNGAPLFTAAAAVAAKDYTASWSLRANPDSTAAGDAMISEFLIYSHTDAAIVELEQVTHAAPTTAASWELSVSGWYDGAVLQNTPVNPVTALRISAGAHANAEAIEDWVSARAAYSGTARDAPTEPVGPIPVAADLGAVGLFAGRHPWGYTAAHARGTQRRNWAPLVNETFRATPAINMETAANWLADAPDNGEFCLPLHLARWVPVPVGATHARVRLHTTTDEGTIQVRLRCYAFNRLPWSPTIGGQPAPPLEYYSRGVSFTRFGSAWDDLGLVRLPAFAGPAAGWTGSVHLAIAVNIDILDNEDIALLIGAWHAVPVFQSMIGMVDP